MTEDEIIALAVEHAICSAHDMKEFDHHGLIKFAALVAAKAAQDERKNCEQNCRD